MKRGLVSYVKSVDLGDVLIVGRSRIHQSKSWYYLGPIETSKVEIFLKIVFGYKSLKFFYKKLPIDASNKHILCFVSEDFAS